MNALHVNHQMMHSDALDAHFDELAADDLAPMDEIEYEESDGFETAVEVELLLARVQASRFTEA